MKTNTTFIMSKIYIKLCLLLLPTLMCAQGIWSTASTDGLTPRAYPCAAQVDGKIYLMGGFANILASGSRNDCEVYDPVSDSWTTPETTGSFTARGGATASAINGKIYVIGGSDISSTSLNLVQVLDPAKGSWTSLKPSGNFTARNRHVSAIIDGLIYIIGGSQQSTYISKVEVYNPSTNTWNTESTTGTFTPRRGSAVAVVNNKIYVFGGFNGVQYFNIMEVFDPTTNTWSTPTVTNEPIPRGGAVASVIDGQIYIIGGYSNGMLPENIDKFDPNTNTWSEVSTTGTFTTRSGATATIVNGKIYVIGGGQSDPIAAYNEVLSIKSLGIKSEESSDFQLSPNPTNSIIKVNGLPEHTQHVSIINMLGVLMIEIKKPNTHQCELDLSGLPCGVYLAKITTSESTITKLVVKQ